MSEPRESALERGCRVERRGIFLLRDPRNFRGFGHELDLSQLGFLEAKKSGHLDNLAWTHKVFWVGTELFYAGAKLAATHSLRNVEAEHAFAVLPVMGTEFTNYHGTKSLKASRLEPKLQALSAPKQRRASC